MSTLQGTELFAARKRRNGVGGGSTDGAKRTLVEGKGIGRVNVGIQGLSLSKPSSVSSVSSPISRAAGAIAPCSKGSTRVQEAIHKEVDYRREGTEKLPETTMQVYQFVKKRFIIPDGFEKDHKYGPLSGVSHEVRVISAYMAGQLKTRFKEQEAAKMCMECGSMGHFPRYCPSVLE